MEKGLDEEATCSVSDALAGEDRLVTKAAALQLKGRPTEATAARAKREGRMEACCSTRLVTPMEAADAQACCVHGETARRRCRIWGVMSVRDSNCRSGFQFVSDDL